MLHAIINSVASDVVGPSHHSLISTVTDMEWPIASRHEQGIHCFVIVSHESQPFSPVGHVGVKYQSASSTIYYRTNDGSPYAQ